MAVKLKAFSRGFKAVLVGLVLIISQRHCNGHSSFYNHTDQISVDLTSSEDASNSTILHLFARAGNPNRTREEEPDKNSEEENVYKQMEENAEMKTQTTPGNEKGTTKGDETYLGSRSHSANTTSAALNREARNTDPSNHINEIETAVEVIDDENNPDAALNGFYTDCLLSLSFPCVQRKMLVYIDRMDRMKEFELVSDLISVVRIGESSRRPKMTEQNLAEPRMSTVDSIKTLDSLLDYSIQRYMFSHALKVKVPSWSSVSLGGSRQYAPEGGVVKLSLAPLEISEGRGHGKGAMKMAASMLKMMMVGKGMMIPVMVGMTKLMGMKGMFMGLMSMIMMKMMFLTKMKSSGGMNMGCGGGGGGGCGMMAMLFGGGGD